MIAKNLSSYIFLGSYIRFLQDANVNYFIQEPGWVIGNINAFLSDCENNQMHVTLRASWKLINFKDKIIIREPGTRLTMEEAAELSTIMTEIRLTLDAETAGLYAYVVTDKRIDVNKLLNNISALFRPDVYNCLPNIAQSDFSNAGKCIAYELPTAAAFHILRGTEGVVRHFYCCCFRGKHFENLMWGPMIESLRKSTTPLPEALLDNLDNIRRSFRNPTQHPEKIYDVHEVQDLFSLCIDVVNRMVTNDIWEDLAIIEAATTTEYPKTKADKIKK